MFKMLALTSLVIEVMLHNLAASFVGRLVVDSYASTDLQYTTLNAGVHTGHKCQEGAEHNAAEFTSDQN